MEKTTETKKTQKQAVVKAVILVAFIVSAISLIKLTSLKDFLTVDQLDQLLQTTGHWAPAVFMAIYALGVCLFIPGTVLGAMGAVLFGAYWGFVYVWAGAMAGAVLAFFIGRYLGREFAASLIGEKFKKYDDAIERNGFATVLYLRLVYFPFTPMNFGMGLTKVRFQDYIIGTGLGISVGTFIYLFFIGTLKDVWASGNWGALASPKVFFSVSLFVFSLFIPRIINRIKSGTPPAQ
ncbi:MAG: TVP38/TMEM64 family protein [Desulfobacterales bacterium]|nr:TVP38/TMEM64 family protein [Desulfobacterales bacterium]